MHCAKLIIVCRFGTNYQGFEYADMQNADTISTVTRMLIEYKNVKNQIVTPMNVNEHNLSPEKDCRRILLGFVLVLLACLLLATKMIMEQNANSKEEIPSKREDAYANKLQMWTLG